MGRDKSLMVIHQHPQRQHLFNLLKNFCREVYLSCKDESGVPPALNPIVDIFQIDSPLNGILSAFARDPEMAWLTVAVDMPFVDAPAIQQLLTQRDSGKVASCFRDSDGRKPEPLFTLWEPRAFPLLRQFHDEGHISPREFLMKNDIELLTIPDRRTLANINSPEELKSLKIP